MIEELTASLTPRERLWNKRFKEKAPDTTEEEIHESVDGYQAGVTAGCMKLMQFREILELMETPSKYEDTEDPLVYVKLWNPYGPGTWLILDWIKEDDIAFCWADLGIAGCAEYGDVSLKELATTVTFMLELGIEIEMHTPVQPISKFSGLELPL